jgi:hypothetical protein
VCTVTDCGTAQSLPHLWTSSPTAPPVCPRWVLLINTLRMLSTVDSMKRTWNAVLLCMCMLWAHATSTLHLRAAIRRALPHWILLVRLALHLRFDQRALQRLAAHIRHSIHSTYHMQHCTVQHCTARHAHDNRLSATGVRTRTSIRAVARCST